MTPLTRALYWAMIGFAALVVLAALWIGWWLAAGLGIVFALLFALAAPTILGRRWRPRPPAPPARRRPVRRRR